MASWNYIAGVIALIFAMGYYFYFIGSNGEAVDKRKLFPYLTFTVNFLVLTVALWTLGCSSILFSVLLVPAALLISLFLIKITKFCDGCGCGSPSYVSFRSVACCSKCGKQFAV